jgi:hypothetical protein
MLISTICLYLVFCNEDHRENVVRLWEELLACCWETGEVRILTDFYPVPCIDWFLYPVLYMYNNFNWFLSCHIHTFIRINYMYMQLLFDWPMCWLFFHDYYYISLWLIVLNLLYLYKKCWEDKMWLMLFTHHSYKTPS